MRGGRSKWKRRMEEKDEIVRIIAVATINYRHKRQLLSQQQQLSLLQ
jgi:hypothetical protein